MCTLNLSEYDTFEIEKITTTSFPATTIEAHGASVPFCKKCGNQETQVFLKNGNKYCKRCFLIILRHKFRATLSKSKSVHTNDSILVAHSGKANSTLLLHLITTDTNESISKKPQFSFKVLYVDDGIAKGRSIKERESIQSALAKEAENLQFSTYILPLSNCVTDSICEEMQLVNVPLMNTTSENTTVQEIFDNLENDTAKDELLQQLRLKLLVSAARKLNCNKIFIADASVDLAVKVLGNVSTGRGSQLPFNVAFSDRRYEDVTLLRPLRDFTRDDITGYLECYNLHPIFNCDKYNSSFPASIRNVTKNFVYKLDSEFHSTVPTIYRTSEKLATKRMECENNNTKIDDNVDNNICVLCELTSNSSYLSKEQPSVAQAKLFSKLVSTVADTSLNMATNSLNIHELSSNEQIKSTNALKKEKHQCQSDIHKSFLKQSIIEKYLCYGCRLIFLNSKQVDSILPNFISNAIQKKSQIAHLEKEISNFLL
ncbi:Cytoplasmic tRNA 2-thiolation protein 2 A [Melipona quadrifasciata]|uniref:Cytoplasmic tRNA 2-thiolation protein 2 n=1 Tax=Melipona quadrifasciata TaxID=166423 RepID=A0A0N0BGT8_9HYME|nr:Cytoplasmic tRNA 2-thiolation protein 2 A [Melipona quadrifasciata]